MDNRFDEYFERKNVLDFIDELKHSERYFQKEIGHFEKYPFHVSNELALYIFYDALYLYKIILDDSSLFDEYMEQLKNFIESSIILIKLLMGFIN